MLVCFHTCILIVLFQFIYMSIYAGWQYHPIFIKDAPIELSRSVGYARDVEVLMHSTVSTCPRVGARCYPRSSWDN
jgi:hypothetical protein